MKYMKLGSKPDAFQSDGNIRFVATELASDVVITVGNVKFYLHKYPLLSKSSRLQRLVLTISDDDGDGSAAAGEIDVSEIPGGATAFEACAKFCYGMVVTLNAYNVLAVRCAAEYLEMFEGVDKGNLVYKIDVFLSTSVFRAWKDSIIVLQTARSLLPWSEDLKAVAHAVDCIAVRASVDPADVDWSYSYNHKKLAAAADANDWNGVRKLPAVPRDWWVEDLCDLDVEFYKRVVSAVKAKGRVPADVVGEALRAYARRKLSGLLDGEPVNPAAVTESSTYRTVLETVVRLLPDEDCAVSCSFLLRLLRVARVLNASEACDDELVRRISRQLDGAVVADLLIPVARSGENGGDGGTIHDVELVLRIVREFVKLQDASELDGNEIVEVGMPPPSAAARDAVAKLVEGYLAEVAVNPTLALERFIELAKAATVPARPVHDGLYRAIDIYLKEHPSMTKADRKQLCSLMDCRRLSSEALVHAVQNDRLPVRIVVQALVCEQLRPTAAPPLVATGNGASSRHSLLPRENGNSQSSSRSAATTTITTTEDEWGAVPTAGDGGSFRSMRLDNKSRSSAGSSSGEAGRNDDDRNGPAGKGKSIMMPKRILSKLWSSGKPQGENSGSDTSGSPAGSVHPEEARPVLPPPAPPVAKVNRHSVS